MNNYFRNSLKPIINGEPKIFFISQHENNFLEHIPKPPSFLPFNTEINLDGFCKDGFDFIKKSNKYQSNYIKGCFLEDALNDNYNSLNPIVEKYKSNFPNDFQDEWIDEINS